MGSKHKEETKVLQQFVKEVAFGFDPLYDYTHEGESDRKERKPRERNRHVQVSTDSCTGDHSARQILLDCDAAQ